MTTHEVTARFTFSSEAQRRTLEFWECFAREWAESEKFRKALQEVAEAGRKPASEALEEIAALRRKLVEEDGR